MNDISRRDFSKILGALTLLSSGSLISTGAQAKTYLTIEQAQKLLWGDTPLTPKSVELSKEQMKAIKKASDVRVRNSKVNGWTTPDNGWFIVDQVIGKHENIDLAFAFDNEGKVLGLEILTYRETYGFEVNNPKWRAQFYGKDHSEHLKLDYQIQNISGATLSCAHLTDGVNRLAQTWKLVLKDMAQPPKPDALPVTEMQTDNKS